MATFYLVKIYINSMSNLDQLTAKIQKLVPEIMELKKGCRVFVKNYIISIEILLDKTGWTEIKSYNPLDYIGFSGSDDLVNFDEKHITKILGRDITLEDILKCLGKIKLGELKSFAYSVDVNCKELHINIEKADYYEASKYDYVCSWQLGLPLHLQSQETIDWLNQVIE